MLNKNYPGNESFTITLPDLWYFLMSNLDVIRNFNIAYLLTGLFSGRWDGRNKR